MALAEAQAKGNGDSRIRASGMQFGGQAAAGSSHRLLLLAAACGVLMRSHGGGIDEEIAQRLGV